MKLLKNQMFIKKKRVVYLTGTRADYGLFRNTLFALNKICNLELIVTGMHLEKEFGYTAKEIKKDRFKIIKSIKFPHEQKNLSAMAANFDFLVKTLGKFLKGKKFDIALVEGDRYEALALAMAAKQNNIFVFHQGGGDQTGSIDNEIRNIITGIADEHFPGNIRSAEHLAEMGVSKKHIFMFGEPGLDDVANRNFLPTREVYKKYHIDKNKKLILFIQHPDLKSPISPIKQIRPSLEALKKMGFPAIIIYPNNDAGGLEIIKEIKKYEHLPFIKTFTSLSRTDFLGFLNICDIVAGNTSAGLTEASLLRVPFINIGQRQGERLCDANVVKVSLFEKEIIKAIKSNLNKKGNFKIKYVYGRGKFTPQFANFIKFYDRNR